MLESINEWLDGLALWQLLLFGFGIFAVVIAITVVYPKFNYSENGWLRKKLKDLGDLQGMTYDEVVKELGEPNSFANSADGTKVCQWLKANVVAGTTVVLAFDKDGICLGTMAGAKFDLLKGG